MPNEASVSAAGGNKTVPTDTKPKAKNKRLKPDTKGMNTLTVQALSMLYRMMTDESLKPSDRLSAVKTALDYASKLPEAERENALTIVFENIPKEYAE